MRIGNVNEIKIASEFSVVGIQRGYASMSLKESESNVFKPVMPKHTKGTAQVDAACKVRDVHGRTLFWKNCGFYWKII